jgi:predicted RNA-binding Zn ribbon-like protein
VQSKEGNTNMPRKNIQLALDFANTRGWHESDNPEELLNTYRDVVKWCEQSGVLDSKEAAHLLETGNHRVSATRELLHGAITLRKSLYRIFSAVATKIPPQDIDIDTLNEHLAKVMAETRLVYMSQRFILHQARRNEAFHFMLDPVVRSAADLLLSDEVGRIKKCADQSCGWLYIDGSKNRSRKWCDMKDCGNRAKARRHYQRVRAGKNRSAATNEKNYRVKRDPV